MLINSESCRDLILNLYGCQRHPCPFLIHTQLSPMDLVVDRSRGTYSRSRSHRQSIGYWDFEQVGTNSVVTHVLVLSAKVRRNEWLKSVVMTYSRHW